MARTDLYEIKYDDGTTRYRKLNADDAKRFQQAADDKRSQVKSVAKVANDKQRTPQHNK